MYVVSSALVLLVVFFALIVLVSRQTPWYTSLYTESSQATAKYRQEMLNVESLMLKFAYENGFFSREAFSEYVPGVAECAQCSKHIETAIHTLTMGNRLRREEGSNNYVLTEHAKKLLVYVDEHPEAHAYAILPMHKIGYWHKTLHVDHSHLLV